MCSLNNCKYDCNIDEISKNVKDLQITKTLCRKCKCDDADVSLIGQSGYCKTCFLIVINHKFRAALGKSKIIRHGDSVLIDHTDKLNSIVLLHLIKTGMSESVHKRLIFKTTILYIEDCTVVGRTIEEKKILKHKIAEEIKNLGFNSYIVSLSEVLSKEDNLNIQPMDHFEINKENDDQLNAVLVNLPDDTSRIDFINQLRQRLLILAARRLNCNKIFIADSTMDIAAKVFGDVCLGRGAQLSTVANFCDARYIDIKILKPMRDFTQQELMYYSEYYKINRDKFKEFDTVASITSIQALARNFIMELESQFIGTVSTVFRTAEKISPKANTQQNERSCAFCDMRLVLASSDNGVSAMRAIEVSKLVSSKYIDGRIVNNKENNKLDCTTPCSDNEICCNDNAECNCEENKTRQMIVKDLWKCLCYSCRQIFCKPEVLHILPLSLLFAIQKRLSLSGMKERINDYLI